MILNRNKALTLNTVFSKKELIVKYISSENYVKILYMKRLIKNTIDQLIEDESQLAKDVGYDESKPETLKEFQDKLKPLQEKFEVRVYDPFLTLEEFKPYAEMLDTESASILAEYLLKDFKE